jgi:D-inositol-3-phosphate glycosyltransferase
VTPACTFETPLGDHDGYLGRVTPRPLTVVVVSPLPPDRGGIAHTSDRIVEAMRAQGHSVEAIAWRRHYPRMLYPGETTPIRGSSSRDTLFMLEWYNPLTWWRASRIARRSDVVVFAWVTAWDAFPYWVIAFGSRTRCVAIVHNDEPHERLPFAATLTKVFLRRVDRVVALSQTVARGLQSRWPWLDPVVGSHPPSFDIAPRPAPSMPPLRLVHPGYIRDYKGPDIAIRACALARSRGTDVSLRIVGESWTDIEDLRDLITELDLAGDVRIDDGYLSDDDLVDAVLDSHAVILPYRTASQSGLVPLALAAHRPVIITAVGGLVEQVQPGYNAVVADQPTPECVAKAIDALAADYPELASATTEPDMGWDRLATILLE